MQTKLTAQVQQSDYGKQVEDILHRCTHCGFCLATCPTFQLTGDELDSPRGRIYQMKLMMEGEQGFPSSEGRLHLDRCLTCRNCETTCPSGVEYGALVDIGRLMIDEQLQRPWRERVFRATLRRLLLSPAFGPLYRLGRGLRPLLPARLKNKIVAARPAGKLPKTQQHRRQVLMLANCVQPAMLPRVDAATVRVLDALGIGSRTVAESGCCGAINFHLDAQDAAKQQMRNNIDAWLPLLESGQAEAVVVNASGCGGMIKDYARHLQYDPDYADKAKRLMHYVKDVVEVVEPEAERLRELMAASDEPLAFHPPCTLQHWQGLRARTERLLVTLGFDSRPFEEKHLCCGAAGTYSVTQPEMATQLRDRKLEHIEKAQPATIASANVGCICHLQSGTDTPVRHWIEIVDDAIAAKKQAHAA